MEAGQNVQAGWFAVPGGAGGRAGGSYLLSGGRLWRHYRRQAGAGRPPRLLNGRDICRLLGVRPGPLVGRLLEELAVAQLEGRVRDRAQAEALVRRLAEEI